MWYNLNALHVVYGGDSEKISCKAFFICFIVLSFSVNNGLDAMSIMFQVKSRMMGDSAYKSTIDCFIKTLKNEVCLLSLKFWKVKIKRGNS